MSTSSTDNVTPATPAEEQTIPEYLNHDAARHRLIVETFNRLDRMRSEILAKIQAEFQELREMWSTIREHDSDEAA